MASSIYDPYCIFLTQASIGAPVDRDPVLDNVIDAADINKVNNFDYSDDPVKSGVHLPHTFAR